VRACTDPLTGGASHPKTERPSADAEESTAEPMWATCPARACVRLCARCCQAATCKAYTLKEAHAARRRHVQAGVYACKASPERCSSSW
jgi:hypothetical protein